MPLESQRRRLEVEKGSMVADLERRSVRSQDFVRFFRATKWFMPLESQRRLLEVGEVSRLVDLERRFVKSHDPVGIWLDFSGLPRSLCLWKVREGGWRSFCSVLIGSFQIILF